MSRFPRCRKVGGRTGLVPGTAPMSIASRAPSRSTRNARKTARFRHFRPAVCPFAVTPADAPSVLPSCRNSHGLSGLGMSAIGRHAIAPDGCAALARSLAAAGWPLQLQRQPRSSGSLRRHPAGRRRAHADARRRRASATSSTTWDAATAASSSRPRRSSAPAASASTSIPALIARGTGERAAGGRREAGDFRVQDAHDRRRLRRDGRDALPAGRIEREAAPDPDAQLRPGARIVSHNFAMGDWEPDVVDTFTDAAGVDANAVLVDGGMSERHRV